MYSAGLQAGKKLLGERWLFISFLCGTGEMREAETIM